MKLLQRRFVIIVVSTFAIFFTLWLELFVQRKHHLIGGGVNRTFLFLLINAHLVTVAVLLYLIVRHSIKLFLERRKGVAGSVFTSNLLFAFMLLSVIPASVIFFTAGNFVTKSIDRWFQAGLGSGLASGVRLHQLNTRLERDQMSDWGMRAFAALQPFLQVPIDQAKLQAHLEALRLSLKLPEKASLFVWRAERVRHDPALHDEAQIWRLFRTLNDRSIKSLKDRFIAEITKTDSARVFDFYGSLYWSQRCGEYVCVVAYRYPTLIRQELVRLENAMHDYEQLQDVRRTVYLNYYFTFAALVLLILFLALWCAFYLARGISKPIQRLLDATEKIRQGDWDTVVDVDPTSDLQSLARGFNEMVAAVKGAHAELVKSNTIKTWQEAAQQMAHEIKNPLTPIQLATERLQRKCGAALQQDQIFLDCTNTILQQVKIIKDLVTHFSEFAAMPLPYIEQTNINELITEVLCLYRVGYPDIIFSYEMLKCNELIRTDRKKVQLVLINLLDNSVRALSKHGVTAPKNITISVSRDIASHSLRIIFQDSGPGIPDSVRDTLFMPYVSTEQKNMGLGLAIVNDIVTQLGGRITLVPVQCGAMFEIILSCSEVCA